MPEITMENVSDTFKAKRLTPEEAETIGKTIQLIEEHFVMLAEQVIANVPRCAHRSAALRDLLQAKMMCVDAIAKGGLI